MKSAPVLFWILWTYIVLLLLWLFEMAYDWITPLWAWITCYQTLVAGFLGVIGGLIAFSAVHNQTRHLRRQAEIKNLRREFKVNEIVGRNIHRSYMNTLSHVLAFENLVNDIKKDMDFATKEYVEYFGRNVALPVKIKPDHNSILQPIIREKIKKINKIYGSVAFEMLPDPFEGDFAIKWIRGNGKYYYQQVAQINEYIKQVRYQISERQGEILNVLHDED